MHLNFGKNLFANKFSAGVQHESFAADAKAAADADAAQGAQRMQAVVQEDPSLITPKKRGPPAGPPAGAPKAAKVAALPPSSSTGLAV